MGMTPIVLMPLLATLHLLEGKREKEANGREDA